MSREIQLFNDEGNHWEDFCGFSGIDNKKSQENTPEDQFQNSWTSVSDKSFTPVDGNVVKQDKSHPNNSKKSVTFNIDDNLCEKEGQVVASTSLENHEKFPSKKRGRPSKQNRTGQSTKHKKRKMTYKKKEDNEISSIANLDSSTTSGLINEAENKITPKKQDQKSCLIGLAVDSPNNSKEKDQHKLKNEKGLLVTKKRGRPVKVRVESQSNGESSKQVEVTYNKRKRKLKKKQLENFKSERLKKRKYIKNPVTGADIYRKIYKEKSKYRRNTSTPTEKKDTQRANKLNLENEGETSERLKTVNYKNSNVERESCPHKKNKINQTKPCRWCNRKKNTFSKPTNLSCTERNLKSCDKLTKKRGIIKNIRSSTRKRKSTERMIDSVFSYDLSNLDSEISDDSFVGFRERKKISSSKNEEENQNTDNQSGDIAKNISDDDSDYEDLEVMFLGKQLERERQRLQKKLIEIDERVKKNQLTRLSIKSQLRKHYAKKRIQNRDIDTSSKNRFLPSEELKSKKNESSETSETIKTSLKNFRYPRSEPIEVFKTGGRSFRFNEARAIIQRSIEDRNILASPEEGKSPTNDQRPAGNNQSVQTPNIHEKSGQSTGEHESLPNFETSSCSRNSPEDSYNNLPNFESDTLSYSSSVKNIHGDFRNKNNTQKVDAAKYKSGKKMSNLDYLLKNYRDMHNIKLLCV